MAGKPKEFTREQRDAVKRMALAGFAEAVIAKITGCAVMTLRKHFKDELQFGSHLAIAAVAGALFKSAMKGNVAAQIFIMKTRAHWRETDREAAGGKEMRRFVVEEIPCADEH